MMYEKLGLLSVLGGNIHRPGTSIMFYFQACKYNTFIFCVCSTVFYTVK